MGVNKANETCDAGSVYARADFMAEIKPVIVRITHGLFPDKPNLSLIVAMEAEYHLTSWLNNQQVNANNKKENVAIDLGVYQLLSQAYGEQRSRESLARATIAKAYYTHLLYPCEEVKGRGRIHHTQIKNRDTEWERIQQAMPSLPKDFEMFYWLTGSNWYVGKLNAQHAESDIGGASHLPLTQRYGDRVLEARRKFTYGMPEEVPTIGRSKKQKPWIREPKRDAARGSRSLGNLSELLGYLEGRLGTSGKLCPVERRMLRLMDAQGGTIFADCQ